MELFYRVHDGKSLAASGKVDLVVFLRGKWAVLSFENDEVGTADALPKGHGCGVSYGTLGRVGGVMTCEYAGSFDTVQDAPIPSGPAAGQMAVHGGVLTVSGTKSVDGDFRAIRGDTLPNALRQYTDKLSSLDSAFKRDAFPY